MKILRFTAVWCGGCLVMNKIWKNIELLYPNIEITKYDYDIDEEIVKQYKIGEILPVTILCKNNQEVKRLIGEKTQQEIIEEIESMI